MKRSRLLPLVPLVAVALALCWQSPRLAAAPEGAATKPAIAITDILAWKTLNSPVVSEDGRWLAYRVSPTEGDSEVIVRQLQGDKEYRFGCGDTGRLGGDLAFSEDGKWVAFSVYPTKKEAAQLKKQRKPLQNKVTVVEVGTGKETSFAKVRKFAFSGGKAGWLALQKYGPDAAPGAGLSGPTPGGTASAASGAGANDKPRGSDLILRDLATGAELNIGNVAEFAFDKPGTWLAWAIDAQDQDGNGVAVRNLETGAVLPLDSGKASYERLAWTTEKGNALAVLKGIEDKAYKDKLYSLVAFSGFDGGQPAKIAYDPAGDKSFPAGMSISPDRSPAWMDDLSAVTFGIRPLKKKTDDKSAAKADAKPSDDKADKTDAKDKPEADKAEPDPDEKPDLVLWHYQDKRLQSQQQVEEDRDKRFSFVSLYRTKEGKFVRLADDTVRDVTMTGRSRWAIGSDNSGYERTGGMDGRRYEDVYTIDLSTGERKLAIRKARWFSSASPDASRLLYFEDGHYFVYDAASAKALNVTAGLPVAFVDERDDHNVVKPPTSAIGWVKDSSAVLLSDGWDIWMVPVAGPGAGAAAVNLTVTGRKDQVRYQRRFILDPDERGIDLDKPVLVSSYGEWTKKGGVARVERARPGAQPLLWDEAAFARVVKAKKADVFLYTRETHNEPADLYVADAALKGGRKVTALDAQVGKFAWSAGRMLVDYKPDEKTLKADRLQAALFLPANYEKGKSYPTIVYIYERLSDGLNRFTAPTANGFNKSVYTSNGYAVLMPDITYKVNDPGKSAVWCVLPALRAAIATGVVDAKRVGLQGHSWGGYQTAFLVTQSNAFAAAVAGAPLTDMVSMYSLIYKNSGSTNQGIFESSQGRFFGGYWDNWEAYYRNSPVFFAKNVQTPLMILHNDKDGAVDFTQGVEYFNTLRRIGKPVWMLEYVGENHGLAKPANMKDYTLRMREFFDAYLMGKTTPGWMKEGVSRVNMEDHLKERAELLKPKTDEKAADAKPGAEPVKK